MIVAAAVSALVLSASALAVGGGSRSAPSQWKIRLQPATWSGRLSALYPGAADDVELFPFTVTNAGGASQRLHAVSAAVVTGGGGDVETARGALIRGCRASWFALSVHSRGRSLPLTLAPGATYAGQLDLSMGASAADQDACRGSAPAFIVSAR